jgi:hypothetical protein
LRYRIFSGALAPGTRLPAIRQAGELWGLHYHTVRRTYGDLAKEGLVESRPGAGTRVLSPSPGGGSLSSHLRRFLDQVRDLYGATPAAVEELLRTQWLAETDSVSATPLWVVECSATLSQNLARYLVRRWGVDARGWPLDHIESIPDGPVLGTYFHAREIRERLADRHAADRLAFVSVQLDPVGLADALEPSAGITTLVFCERDEESAHDVAADLRWHLPEGVEIDVVVTHRPASLLTRVAPGTQVMLSPGSWDGLTAHQRARAGVHCLPVRVKPAEDGELETFLSRVMPARASHVGSRLPGPDRLGGDGGSIGAVE